MEEIAQVYARSLFEVAQEQGILDPIREQLGRVRDALNDNREMAIFFFSPYFSTEEKKAGLRRAVTGADPFFINFLDALIERHRMPAIFRIRARYQELWDETNQLLPVQITSAVAARRRRRSQRRAADRRADRQGDRAEQHRRSRDPRRDRAARR